MSNIPKKAMDFVLEDKTLSAKEREDIIRDLEQRYTKKREREREHKENMENDPNYRKFWNMWNGVSED